MPARTDDVITTVTPRLFLRELDARGIDGEEALVAAGLTRAVVGDVSNEITWPQCLRMVDRALQLAPGDDLGVLAGTRAELTDLDLMGLYLRSNPNVREALEFYREHRNVLEPSRATHIYIAGDAFVIALADQDQERSRARAAVAECMLATTMSLMRLTLGEISPTETRFRHNRPANDQAHARTFGVVRFGSDVDALFFPVDVLDRPLPQHDDTIRAVLEPHLARQVELARAARADLPTRVLNGIQQDLAGGKTSVESLAKRLRLSPRSLRRELSTLDTSYTDLLARARRELALQQALETPRRSGSEIAQRLGYADAHTFYRAFKRWTGLSLTAYRERSTPTVEPVEPARQLGNDS